MFPPRPVQLTWMSSPALSRSFSFPGITRNVCAPKKSRCPCKSDAGSVSDLEKYSSSGGSLDSTGPLGDSGLAYRMIIDHEDEDYWRNFGLHRETLIAPSLAWYGDNTRVLLAYEHREFLTPFDRGTAINPATNHPLDIPATRLFSATNSRHLLR